MKHFCPIAFNSKLKTIVDKLAKLKPKPVDHKYLIRKHGLDEKKYLDTYSKIMNK